MSSQNNKYESVISEQEWLQIIQNKLQTSDFRIVDKWIGPLSEDQVGFMGDHLKLRASVRVGGDSERVDLEFFAKTVPVGNEAFKEYVDGTQSFDKEYYFFSTLVSALERHWQQRGTGSWACKCYLARRDLVVLEDLIREGYQLLEPRTLMDYDHCIVVIQTLARFHASSVVLEENLPRKPNGEVTKLTDKYPEMFFETEWVTTEGHPGNGLLVSSIKAALNLVKRLPGHRDNAEVAGKLPGTLMDLCELVKPSDRYRNVVNHGDLWSSNVFFKYGRDSRPSEACFIDFQLFRYTPPANDLMCFLHLVTSRRFREENLDRFVTEYYKTFAGELRRHGFEPDDVQFSWQEFRDSCDYYRRAGRVTAAVFLQHIIINGEVLKKIMSDPRDMFMFMRVDKTKYVLDNYVRDEFYREQNTEALVELIEQCVLGDSTSKQQRYYK